MNVRPSPACLLALAGLLLGGRPALAHQPQVRDTALVPLALGRSIERPMRAGEVHRYGVVLVAGQVLRAVVEQRGIDVVVAVFEPDGRILVEIDEPIGSHGPETIDVEAAYSGTYRLEVRPFLEDAAPGRYEVRIASILGAEEAAADREAARRWLSGNAIRLRTVQAGHGFDDLQPLRTLIDDARVVALGEATHGTREFFQLKHRMLEFLVSELGFTVFAMEAAMPEGFDVNAYVLGGRGDAGGVLAGLNLWVWDTEEVLELIRWMRRYNEDSSHRRKVRFYGFDMQYQIRPAKRALEYLERVDPEQAARLKAGLGGFANPFRVSRGDDWSQPRESTTALLALVRETAERLEERRASYIASAGEAEWAVARQHLRILEQNLTMRTTPGANVRDSAMAENIRWILEREGPEARIVVWAHNDHVATQPGQMGWHLRRMFGPDLLTVGFAFNRGSFQTMQLHPLQGGTLRAFTVGPAPAGSFDGTLAAAGLTLAAVDLRRIPDDGPAHRWFTSARATHSIGGGYLEADDMSFRGLSARQVLPSHYDAILFVDTTTAARPTASGQVRPRAILEAPRNLGFEEGPPGDTPPGWEPPTRLAGVLYQAATSVERPSSGARCAVIRRLPGERYSEVGGSLVQQVAAGPYRGRSIAVGAAARVEPSASGDHAYLWVRVHGPGRRVQDLGVVRIAGADWQRYEIVGDVAADAEMVAFGLYLVGDGAAYLDAVSIAAVDR